jgi:4-carboxymuconolactone decarboxylase
MSEPRISPLAPADREEVHTVLLDGVGGAVTSEMNIFTTLVRHPRLFRRWLPLGGVLLTGTLPARDRELLILRTADRCGADYEWAHHVVIGKDCGLSDDEIERVRSGPGHDAWSDEDAVLLTAADQLHDQSRISDATWAALAARYDEKQLIELPILVGQYHLVAFALNSLGVQVEEGF